MSVLDQLDLNLLRVLDVLLEQGSVTEAARVLGRSQPAVSHALGRLRDALDDPLFVRQGRRLVPTARAEQLGTTVRRTLAELDRALASGPDFDPQTSTRRFRLAAPDTLGPLVADILAAMAEGPGVTLELWPRTGPRGVDEADVVLDILPERASGVVAKRLGTMHSAVACRTGHPLLGQPWTLQTWCAYPHVLVRTDDRQPSLVERVLEGAGHTRTVGLTVAELLLVPHVVSRTDLLFTGPREVLSLFDTLDLILLEPPLPMPEVPVAALWHERHQHEPGHRWFRERVARVVAAAFTRPAPLAPGRG